MRIGIASRDYKFVIGGTLIKEFKKGKQYIMSNQLMNDIMLNAGKHMFGSIRDLDARVYKKYKGEDLNDKSIMIWRTGGMGDLCFITPYLKKLKELYPKSKVVFGCGVQYSDIMSQHPCIDKFETLPLDLDILKETDYHLMFEGIIEDNEYANNKNAYDLFGDYFGIELKDEEKIPNLPVNQENMEFFKQKEKEFIKVENPIRIGIHLKTSAILRDPYPEMWKKLVHRLMAEDPRICIYVIGAPDDIEVGNQITITQDGLGRFLPLYQIVRGFRDSVAAISELDLMIGGDSSGTHIAAAFKKPIIGLYGAFTPDIRIGYYQNAVGFQSNLKCSPCFKHQNQPCDYSDGDGYSFCMKIYNSDKEIDRIVEEALLLLSIRKKIVINNLKPQTSLKLLQVYREHFKETKKEEVKNA